MVRSLRRSDPAPADRHARLRRRLRRDRPRARRLGDALAALRGLPARMGLLDDRPDLLFGQAGVAGELEVLAEFV